MSHPLYVAFVWHQHQPLYRGASHAPRTGSTEEGSRSSSIAAPPVQYPSSIPYRLPWVRLHGIKDYLDLILLLAEHPSLHQTVNLVPSLILQIEDYVAGVAMDPYLIATLSPVEQLPLDQQRFVVEHFFDAHHHTMIDPYPRYRNLYEQRKEKGVDWCLDNWTYQDFSDLLAWHNLTWFDPLFQEQDPQIARWFEQGKNFTLSDRQQIYAKQREILARIIPEHRRLQDSGQLEVITSPYTHPILPLLADTDAGQVAVPDMTLPKQRFQWPDDITRHLRRAWDMYYDCFGRSPKGLWPSEQSVSPSILPYITEQGFKWICSDEAVLGWTLEHFFHRDATGTVLEPEYLYRPYRLSTPTGDLAIVFRDHRLSDLIGFTYSSMEPKKAAADLVGHLDAIARSLKQRQTHGGTSLQKPWLVTIALDGENCWEFYNKDGKPFLEALYQSLSVNPGIKLVTVGEFLTQFPPTESLPAHRLHSGSWVDGSFTTWIGDPAKNRAWDYLYEARQVLDRHPEATEEANPEAWEALYAAEGSDWFWWFGEGHSSNHDSIFDQLFREHLTLLYKSLNEPVPAYLSLPVDAKAVRPDHKPQGFIHPVIDGRGDEQDWDKAGRIDLGGARGTMHQSSPVQRLWYGVDHLNFYIRLDFQVGIKPGEGCPPELHLLWYYPNRQSYNSPIPLAEVPDAAPTNYLYHHHLGMNLMYETLWFQQAADFHQWQSRSSRAQFAVDRCFELAVPWDDLQIEPDWALSVLAILADDGIFRAYLPDHMLVPIEMP
jgi:alpha-amylase/alpha-mannosidase (GH57 family)